MKLRYPNLWIVSGHVGKYEIESRGTVCLGFLSQLLNIYMCKIA